MKKVVASLLFTVLQCLYTAPKNNAVMTLSCQNVAPGVNNPNCIDLKSL